MSDRKGRYTIKDSAVKEALREFDRAADEAGIDYALGGGFAAQSYIVEAIANRRDTDVEQLSAGDVSTHTRSTEDLDIPVKSYGAMPDLQGTLFTKQGVGGQITEAKDGKYLGEIEVPVGGRTESIDLNIFDNQARGFSEKQFDEQFSNSNRYVDGNTSFVRVGLENLIWMKARGGRQRDIIDLAYLMQLRHEDVDDEYVQDLIEDENVAEVYEQAKNRDWRTQVLDQLR